MKILVLVSVADMLVLIYRYQYRQCNIYVWLDGYRSNPIGHSNGSEEFLSLGKKSKKKLPWNEGYSY